MKKISFVLGGFGTKSSHINRTINVYNNNNIQFNFIESSYKGLGLLMDKTRNLTVDTLIKNIKKNNTDYYLHAFSASDFIIYDIMHNLDNVFKNKCKGIILESSGGSFGINTLQNVIYHTNKLYIPQQVLYQLMKISKIPIDINHNKEYFESYKEKVKLSNVLFLYSSNDKLLDKQHRDTFFTINKNIEFHDFPQAGHCNIAKIYPNEYSKILSEFLQKKS